jgi:hypothetical protein
MIEKWRRQLRTNKKGRGFINGNGKEIEVPLGIF